MGCDLRSARSVHLVLFVRVRVRAQLCMSPLSPSPPSLSLSIIPSVSLSPLDLFRLDLCVILGWQWSASPGVVRFHPAPPHRIPPAERVVLSTCTDRTCLSFRETVVSDSPLSQLLSPRLRTSPPSACALPHTTPPVSSLPAPPSLHLGFFGSLQSPVFGLSTLEQPSVCRPLFKVKVVSQHRPLNTCATWAFSRVCLSGWASTPVSLPQGSDARTHSSFDLSSPHRRCPPLSVHSPHLRALSDLASILLLSHTTVSSRSIA